MVRDLPAYETVQYDTDTDSDGLSDDAEDRNPVDVSCDETQESSASSIGWGDPTLGPSFPSIVNDALLAGLLDDATLYEDPVGAYYAVDANGTPFLVGAYGVNLYPILEEGVPWEWPVPQPTTTTSSSSSGPPASTETNPTRWDTDGDGLGDGAEVSGTLNAFEARSDASRPPGNTDPRRCDTDDDFVQHVIRNADEDNMYRAVPPPGNASGSASATAYGATAGSASWSRRGNARSSSSTTGS